MARGGYSLISVTILCVLSFFAGRFLQTVPVLPEPGSGVSH